MYLSYGLHVSYVQLRTSGMINKRRAVLYPKDHSTYDKVIALGNIEPSSGPVPAGTAVILSSVHRTHKKAVRMRASERPS